MKEKVTIRSFSILNLYRSNYATTMHARAMAAKAGASHVTLLPHLKRLEKAKILLSNKVGRNKEYRLNPNNNLTKNYLSITEELATLSYLEKNFLVKKISSMLSRVDLTGSMVLFGSYAKDYSTVASDIDLFHLGTLPNSHLVEIKKSGRTYGKEINVKTSTVENFRFGLRTGDILTKEVVENHIILQNPGPFVNLLWRDYAER